MIKLYTDHLVSRKLTRHVMVDEEAGQTTYFNSVTEALASIYDHGVHEVFMSGQDSDWTIIFRPAQGDFLPKGK